MTSPFKSDPKASADCNNCGEEYTYNPTYGTGRICADCTDLLDNPANCTFELDLDFDTATRTLSATVTVAHDQPVTVYIPPYDIEEGEGMTYTGRIAKLHVTDDGNTIAEATWDETAHHVLDPNRECRLNINHDKVLGCDGTRSWTTELDVADIDDETTLTFQVTFPAISDIADSALTETFDIPTYTIRLDD